MICLREEWTWPRISTVFPIDISPINLLQSAVPYLRPDTDPPVNHVGGVRPLVIHRVQIEARPNPHNGNISLKNSVEVTSFGKLPSGEPVSLFVLENSHGTRIGLTNFGATITQALLPDRHGKLEDITLGFNGFDEYLKNDPFLGVVAGRFANRIAEGRFSLKGKPYQLAVNNGPNHLHGGNSGFDKKLWSATPLEDRKPEGVKMSYTSPDGEEGYPGKVQTEITYTLNEENELVIHYVARTDQSTPLNLTNHAYWNLAGQASGTLEGQQLKLNASLYTPTDETLIPTGEIKSVAGSPLDFRNFADIYPRLAQIGGTPPGFDHNFVLKKSEREALELAASVIDPNSGRKMDVLTTEPGIQFYTANFLDGSITGKSGTPYQRHAGFCLECQHFPDSPNQPHFPSTILEPGQVYEQTTIHRFSVVN